MSSSHLPVILDALNKKTAELCAICATAAGDPARSVVMGVELERELPGVIRALRSADALIIGASSVSSSSAELCLSVVSALEAAKGLAARALALDCVPGDVTLDYAEAALADIDRAVSRGEGMLSTVLHSAFREDGDSCAHLWPIVAAIAHSLEEVGESPLVSAFYYGLLDVEDAFTLSNLLTQMVEQCLPLFFNSNPWQKKGFGKLLFQLHSGEVAALGGTSPFTCEQYIAAVAIPPCDELKLAV
ncbi:hypothetical protein ACR3H8_19485 [Pseudomonas aeruginosa]|uniref:hypothetical protein n=1 Tax=Pseudomonas aeruginosa group TaxID=136841 RepID=UPI000F81ABA1|nr:hypothetical protein [Pseudomonas aeruginosa]ELD5773002.1 hypothetical protein [Pseudomonas aeruginosa]MBH4465053.1 hypothetical protein [Pseudomonas aeruginosa]MBX5850353.1 hypothetical protein [Pseudomonas aeruginosa]MCF3954379.1 hypothetical protein [Pseudomonas aeruginosa]MCR3806895.1 hypothetical protein [Pseudomonas aeruginosa]